MYFRTPVDHITYSHRYRVYCASEACGRFIHPSGHIEDKENNITYAVCDSDHCFQATCCACKTLLIEDIQGHVCRARQLDKEFKEAVDKNGYKECFTCGATVELAEGTIIPPNTTKSRQLFWFKQSLNHIQVDSTTTFVSFHVKLGFSFSRKLMDLACNHITCECGSEFCYICGKQWDGYHGCPQYGPATYDADGYNEAGYHRDTGLNREGRTHSEEMAHQNASRGVEGDGNDGDDNEEEGEPEVEDLRQRVMNQLEPDQRTMIESLDAETREEALLQIMDAWVAQGVVFDLPQAAQQPQDDQPQDDQPQDDEVDDNGGNDDRNLIDDDQGDGNADEAPGSWGPDPELPIGFSDADEEHTVGHEAPIIQEPIPEPIVDIIDADQEHVVDHEGPVIWEPTPGLPVDLSEDP